ncbi:DNA topoisomerase IB [Roseovarius nanhaiticus]|uniref:DNA topoisomerase n=1 Tax=Roseovarius nanhaiticus TaxID=573024 RepID=A0A1N7FLR4_9RHOB|nr:DNA topoisomerase IB [Roseovarius nanhaiticus]SEK51547.1 DNA topoisomerase-1 [Roseovarius nanhaiticus]SIS01205.1 DNA topoisomerase-1 [Roseovarius nanhaiticus]
MTDLPPSLRYYPDDRPGIRRRRCGRGFSYLAMDGSRIDDAAERARLKALAVPPAWEEVWISPFKDGHLVATGQDARARKQYRYHPEWTALQAAQKFSQLPEFAQALPRIRRRIRRDLAEEPGEEAFAVAAAAAMIDRLSLRVGNPEYTRENGTYGALTLKGRHVRFSEGRLRISYTGKGGKKIRRQLADSRLMKALERIRDLPGAELLTWLGDDGEPRRVTSASLNTYLSEAGGIENLTAKTFRTWSGTVAAFGVAMDLETPTIKAMAEAAAERLHNTPAIARNSYVHPDVLDLARSPRPLPEPSGTRDLTVAEQRLEAFLG